MIAHIYTKTDGVYTSIVVSNKEGEIYFRDAIDVPELTGIQRGASFVKNHLKPDYTEIYQDKVANEDIIKDEYLKHSNIKAILGLMPNKKAESECLKNLLIKQRWTFDRGIKNGR